ncbi:MAG: DNA-binding transcriptional LysR family regulator [Pseudorhodobacter sp.]|jgi:DNA-binding transcriptional LysR family regulator
MRLEWLEDLLAVAETGSFQEAADRRRLTQSAFSRRIQHIEDQVGVELFDRTRKPVQLRATTAEQRDQMVKLANDLRQLVTDLQRGERMATNRITIASQHAITTALTPQILKHIHARYEDINVRLRSANLDECFSLLLTRQADMAIVYRLPGDDHPIGADFVETATIGFDLLIPVIASEMTASLNTRFAEGELPYIAYPDEVFLGKVLERMILPRVRTITRPIPKAETALTLAALEMAALGVAVAWVPRSLAQRRIADGTLADLSTTLPSRPLEVTAVRLFGDAGPVASSVWSEILAQSL